MSNKSLLTNALYASVLPFIWMADHATSETILIGDNFSGPATADRGGRLIVGLGGTGSAQISAGEVIELYSSPRTPDDDADQIIATAPYFNVGEGEGGFGTAIVEGTGTSVTLYGNDNTANIMVGNQGGTGTLTARDGALLRVIDEAATAATGIDFGNAIFVGSREGTGTFVLDNASAEVISKFGAFMFVGNLGGLGTVNVRNGSSLSITEIASDEIGNDGNGATIVVGRSRVDEGGGGGTGSLSIEDSNVTVTSAKAAASLVVGREDGTFGNVQLQAGSDLTLVGQRAFVSIGQDEGSLGVLNMSGGAVLTLNGIDSSNVTVGAAFADFGRDAGGSGTLVMSGTDTRLETSGNVLIGAVESFGGGVGSGTVSVSDDATLKASTVYVGTGGILNGNGGTIDSNVVLDGGTIAPGASPGTMTILGNLDAQSGFFDFEFAGNSPSLFDVLTIAGDLNISDEVTFRFSFLDGYIPMENSIFNFLDVKGSIEGNMTSFVFEGLGDTPGLSIFSKDGSFVLAQSNPFDPGDGTPSVVPLPASALLLLSGVMGLAALRRRRIKAI